MEKELEDMQARQEELLDELEFKDKEIFELQRNNEELEMRFEEIQEEFRMKENGKTI